MMLNWFKNKPYESPTAEQLAFKTYEQLIRSLDTEIKRAAEKGKAEYTHEIEEGLTRDFLVKYYRARNYSVSTKDKIPYPKRANFKDAHEYSVTCLKLSMYYLTNTSSITIGW